MNSTADMLADRYGRRPKSVATKNRRWMFAFLGAALAVFIIWGISAVTAPNNAVALSSSASKPVGKTGFRVSGTVSRPSGGVVRCALQVQALDFSVVGYREITLPAGVTTFDSTVFSVVPGVSASVTRCWLQ